jgi:hypothetical protein
LRKSPIRHHVRQHRRVGKPVHDYMRGHGSHPAKPTVRQGSQSKTAFVVRIDYSNLPSETIPVTAPDYPTAIETAMIMRKNITPPIEVEAAKR